MKKQETDKAQDFYSKTRANKELEKEVHNYAIASFGIALSPIFYYWILFIPILQFVFGIIFGIIFIVGIIVGILGIHKISDSKKYKGIGFAITGICINAIYIFLEIIGLLSKLKYF